MKTISQTLVFAALFNLAIAAQAQSVPSLINYQGQVLNPDGSPPPTADYELTFNIYDAASSGTLIWGPQRFNGQSGPGLGAKVPVVQGYFNVLLGQVDTSNRSIATAFGSATRFLEVRLGTNPPVSPRQRLLSAPYALKAGSADLAADSSTLAGHNWTSLFGVNNPTGPLPGSKLQTLSISPDRIVSASLTAAQIAPQTLTSNQIANGTIGPEKLSPQMQLDSLIPTGTIMAFAGQANAVPPGWGLCDGRILRSGDQPRLFAVIGTTWGNAVDDGDPTTNFRLPDFRGLFLRGVDDSPITGVAGRDPDHGDATRGQMHTGSAFGNRVGSFQTDAYANHQHEIFPKLSGANLGAGSMLQGTITAASYGSASTGPSGSSSETRPKNAYVNYIIKY